MSPQLQGSNFGGVPVPPSATQPSQVRHTGGVIAKAQSAEPPAVWKPPPPHGSIAGAVLIQVDILFHTSTFAYYILWPTHVL